MDTIIGCVPFNASSLNYQLIGEYNFSLRTTQEANFYLSRFQKYSTSFSLINILRNYISTVCVVTELSTICHTYSSSDPPSYQCILEMRYVSSARDDDFKYQLQNGNTVTSQSSYEWIRNEQEYFYFPGSKLFDTDIYFETTAHIFQNICFNTAKVKLYGIPKSAIK